MGENSWNGYERKCLFENVGGDRFVDIARPAGCDALKDGRGAAAADLDGDGRTDLVLNNNDAEPTVFLNRLPGVGRWLDLALEGRGAGGSNRDAVGARVRLTVREGIQAQTMTRDVEAGSGYASQAPAWLHFGLGAGGVPEALEVRWPGGSSERITAIPPGNAFTLREGEGRLVPRPALGSAARFASRPERHPQSP